MIRFKFYNAKLFLKFCLIFIGDRKELYGKQRLWGTVGYGSFSLIMGALVDWYSRDLPSKDYLPAFIICFIFMVTDIGLVVRMPIGARKDNEALKFEALKNVLKMFPVIVFLVILCILIMC